MRYRMLLVVIVGLTALLILPPAGHELARAQEGGESCSAVAQEALALAAQSCEALGRGEACYGHTLVAATGWDNRFLADFVEPGHRLDVDSLATLATAPLDVTSGEWGVALLTTQADLPDTLPGQAVTVLAFGDAMLQSMVTPDQQTAPSATCTAQASSGVNIRSGPGTDYAVPGGLAAGDAVTVSGRNAAGDWFYIANDKLTGWAYAPLLESDCDVEALPDVEDPQARYTAPWQAFYLETGLEGNQSCSAVQEGILIQSPEGSTSHLMINDVALTLSSTAFVTTEDGDMLLTTLEGSVTAQSGGVAQTVAPGVTVRIRPGLVPQIVPGLRFDQVAELPTWALPRPVPIPRVVTVPGGSADTDTGIDVACGEVFEVMATGIVSTGPHPASSSGPEGQDFYCEESGVPVHGACLMMPEPFGALIGWFEGGPTFHVGRGGTFVAEPPCGRLHLAVNDSEFSDNSGAYIVTVFVHRRGE